MHFQRLKNVQFGSTDADAESEEELERYFVQPSYVHAALAGRRNLFLGRKGSGKSALFRQLPNLYRVSEQPQVSVVPLTTDEYSWAALRQYKEAQLPPEAAYTNAWLFTLASRIAAELVQIQHHYTARTAVVAHEALRRYVESNFGRAEISLRSVAAKLPSGIGSVNSSAFGLNLATDWEPNETQLGLPAATLLERLVQLLYFCLQEASLVVVLDRLDECWETTAEAHALLVGLLKATKRLNSELRSPIAGAGLRVITFLRTDIYMQLFFDDKDKLRPTEQPMAWTPQELGDMVTARLPADMQIDDLFRSTNIGNGLHPFQYILDRTFLRPRDVLEFLIECLRVNATKQWITREDLERAQVRYSKWKLSDLQQEYGRAIPYFGRLLRCLAQGFDRYDSLNELTEVLAERNFRLVQQRGSPQLIETLFDASIIGVRFRGADRPVFRYMDEELQLPDEGSFYVHEGLIGGLNLVRR